MGNTPSDMFLPGNEDCSYKVKFRNPAIKVSERKMGTKDEGEAYEQQAVPYKIAERTSKHRLTKTRRAEGYDREEKFIISLQDEVQNWSYSFQMVVQRAQGGELMVSSALVSMGCCNRLKVDLTRNTKTTTAAGGESTITSFNQYGIPNCVNEKGLVAMELKKKGLDESPYMLTVAHYFASFGKTDTGLSMIVKIRADRTEVGDRGLGVQVEGPVQHPAIALFCMFDQVQRTGCWMPTWCSHCVNGNQTQNMSQTASEDNDVIGAAGTSIREPLSSSSSSQTIRSLLSNSGLTVGDDNGSIIFSVDTIVINSGGNLLSS